MTDFFSALLDPSLPFVRHALLGSVLASLLFGILGALVTVRRMASLTGAISHTVLGGIGLALFLAARGAPGWVNPMLGALVFAVAAATVIGFLSLRAKQREDTVINALWAIGMSLGVVFLAKTPGYVDPMSYLFGNILLISGQDLLLLAALDVVVALLVIRFYRQIEAASFDEEFAATRGVPVTAMYLILLAVLAVSIVLLQTLVGIVMVIALFTLPAGTAGYFSRNLAEMMIYGGFLALLFCGGGLALAWSFDLPAGAVIVLLAGTVFLVGSVGKILASRRQRC